MAEYREFETGATRNQDKDKFDYEGFLSPIVLRTFAAYMHKNRLQANGSLRASDNWQKGIPLEAYMKSGFRHFMEWWEQHRSSEPNEMDMEEALCALLFNVMGYLHEYLKGEVNDRIFRDQLQMRGGSRPGEIVPVTEEELTHYRHTGELPQHDQAIHACVGGQ